MKLNEWLYEYHVDIYMYMCTCTIKIMPSIPMALISSNNEGKGYVFHTTGILYLFSKVGLCKTKWKSSKKELEVK